MGGILAMAKVEKFITSPLLKMVDSKDIHILDVSRHYSTLQTKLQQWAEDPTEILDGTALLFPDFPPTKDEVYDSMFTDDIPLAILAMSKHAIAVTLIVLLLVVERALPDHLPGGKYHLDTTGQESLLRNLTNTVPLNNKVAECLFSGLDRLKRCMPNSLTITLEGVLLWAKNKPLSVLPHEKLKDMISWAMSAAKPAREATSETQQTVRDFYKDQETKRKAKKQDQIKKQAMTTENNLQKVFDQPGGPCRSKQDVHKLLAANYSETEKRDVVKTQIRYKQNLYQELLKGHKHLTTFSSRGRALTSRQLQTNLIAIIELVSELAQATDADDDIPLADVFADPDDDIPLNQFVSYSAQDDIPLRVTQRDDRRERFLLELKDKVLTEHQKHQVLF